MFANPQWALCASLCTKISLLLSTPSLPYRFHDFLRPDPSGFCGPCLSTCPPFWSSNHTLTVSHFYESLNINFHLEKFNTNGTNYLWNDVSCCNTCLAPLFCSGFNEGNKSFFCFQPESYFCSSHLISGFQTNGRFCSRSLKVKTNMKRENKLDLIFCPWGLCCNRCQDISSCTQCFQ